MNGEFVIITGRNRAGKTSLAVGVIKNKQNDTKTNVIYAPFAKPLKDDLLAIGFSKDYLDKKTPKARALMRAYGDARREEDTNVFLKKWKSLIKTQLVSDQYNVVVVDDMYLFDEFYSLLELSSDLGFDHVTLTLVKRPSLRALTNEELAFETVIQQQQMEQEIERVYTVRKQNPSRCKSAWKIDKGETLLGITLPIQVWIRVIVNNYSSVEEFVSRHH